MFVQTRNPPLSPLLQHLYSVVVSQSCEPGHGASDGYAVVDISLCYPYSQFLFHENWVEPIACVVEHDIVLSYFITAGFEFFGSYVKSSLNGCSIEEVVDSVHVLTDDSWLHDRNFSVGKSDVFFSIGVIYFLIEAFGVEIEHAGVGGIEFGIHNFSDFLASIGVIAQDAGSCNLHVLIFCVVAVVVQIFILVDAQIDVISGLPTLPGVGACVVDHDSFEVWFYLCLGQFVCLDYLVCEVGDVYSGVALACYVEFVVF